MKNFFNELLQDLFGTIFGWIIFGIGVVTMVFGAIWGGWTWYVPGIALMVVGGYIAAKSQ